MSNKKVQYGSFGGLIPYARWGSGERVMVVFAGGPGNSIPRGMGFSLMAKGFNAFADEYTIYMVTRRLDQPEGFTTRDMSEDYDRMITDHLDGRVDVVVGQSFGGLIAQHFAADHPERFGRIVFAAAAHEMSEIGKDIDYRYAEHLSQGRNRQAAATIVEALIPPGPGRLIMRSLAWLLGNGMYKKEHASFQKDVMVEARAELAHDAGDSLKRIEVPVLIVGGTEDLYFPKQYFEATAERIRNAVLKLYEGKGHMAALADRRFAADLREFVG
jgi:pimeloyl-ACP methyl ester carboxylesterase